MAEHAFPLLNGIRVLVVDNDDEARESIVLMLGLCGATMREAKSTAEGWAIFQDWQPHVLLCDPALPRENGLTFIEKIRGLTDWRAGIPAIGLSHKANGFDLCFSRSVAPAEMAAAVARLASRSQPGPDDEIGIVSTLD